VAALLQARSRLGLQNAEGIPIEGYPLDQCYDMSGDEIERSVAWEQGADVSALQGRPARLRFTLHDADLYALRFVP